ncbi:MAG: FMN-binding glutamate synthase family protein [Rhodospirillales bacterium]|jgi:glutamate synthase domain-containing protein 2|nr:FMN-binding glutamate synthase family protein [Rhodospirillales bacterium]HIJ43237.1 FMN-binding glutamate synthase family protein [Rhodospirillaceae bacterium]HIJ92378.1 FMN-binding glutamate synthase family protein [Rhodospirillaceae bacterium]HJP53458.1 FMN-binding glutamate synthase family protein [Rhodospirillales bacterium]
MDSELLPKIPTGTPVEALPEFVTTSLVFMAVLFIFIVGSGALTLVVLFVVDTTQTKYAVRRNYPVIGRLHHVFERLGKFFRQYFFAMDREEMPFNREQREWVYRAAKNADNTVPFGSTRNLHPIGTLLFLNCPFPTLEEDMRPTTPMTIGPYCAHPYTSDSLFNISAMGYGAISKPATLALSNGARLAGCWMNTGEGGLSPWHLKGGGDLVFQIGTGKFGVRNENWELADDKLAEVAAHEQVRMFEVKLSQGAKPGKGGILPGAKVTEEIAAIRGIPAGKDAISPNRYSEINNVPELIDFVERVRSVTGKPTGVKLVVGAWEWFDELFEEINRRGIEYAPDFITVDGAEGGTGAAPMSLIDYVGLPIQESLPIVIDKLVEHGLRDRIRVIASGKLITPADVAWALCVGADFVVSARGFMFALGCIQALQCNKNTCPTGIATHNPRLQKGLDPRDKAARVMNYARNIVGEVCVIGQSCGVLEPRGLRRYHCRIIMSDGRSAPLDELYPEIRPGVSTTEAA